MHSATSGPIRFGIWLVMILAFASHCSLAGIRLRQLAATTQPDVVEVRGVGAGTFDPKTFESGKFNFVPDVRSPLIEPLPGKFRNIYAPSIVAMPNGWRIFYGAWDGQPTPNDRTYFVDSPDFLSFGPHTKIIEHGEFDHVCNVSAQRAADGSFKLICTGFPDAHGKNKPVFFSSSPDGKTWNGSPPPDRATQSDIVSIDGYPNYSNADINGMNVLVRDGSMFHLYFGDFSNFGKTFRATSDDGKHYRLDGQVFAGQYAVNDVKRFNVGNHDWYLMGLHMNTNGLWYSLSDDPMKFPQAQLLARPLGASDRYIVAIGFVVRDNALLGFLYGAGATPNLCENRIFARWLQKTIVVDDQRGKLADGPDCVLVSLPHDHKPAGVLRVLGEDGETELGRIDSPALEPGHCYQLTLP